MKKLFLMLGLVLVTFSGISQTVAPDGTKPYLIFDQTYELQPVGSGIPTDVAIYYDNQAGTAIKALQFRFWYDPSVFDIPTVSYVGPESNNYFQTLVNPSEGNVTVTWVYTGSSTTFNITPGQMFSISLPFQPSYQNGSVNAMSFVGVSSYPSYGTLADGSDTALGLHNYGGEFTEPTFEYAATFLNSPSNPSSDIPVKLQKSSNGSTWTDVEVVSTDVNGVANFQTKLDQSYWQIRLQVDPQPMNPAALSTADANMIAQIATGLQQPTGTQFYTANPNLTNGITVSDSYTVFSRLAQNLSAYPNTPDILFFTENEYTQIVASPVDLTSTIPGQSTFISVNINGTTAANYYLLVLGDANGTGHN